MKKNLLGPGGAIAALFHSQALVGKQIPRGQEPGLIFYQNMGLEWKFIWKKVFFGKGTKTFSFIKGNTKGLQRNPSHDSNMFFVGIVYNNF